ncbi:MAG: hypothetical protein MRY32_09940 [Rickettsiales bacterium]|nr:hypothetical protein [Rickettsiales bacterium]
MNDSHNKPISTFDEICHITIETMRKMDMETLLGLKKQAVRELDRAKLTKGCIDLALSLKQQDHDREVAQADANQPSMLD